ncbi:MAG: NAD-dependent epimerase/dehydratase family protein [bacterium]|nr:NAD-dependent epimerase/dehydratase family protein [bacterium]
MKKNKAKQLRIGVTGAAGFIGSNLCKKLLENLNYKVIGIDNLSRGLKSNLEDLMENKNIRFHKVNVCDLAATAKALKGVDIIVHLAAYKIPRYGHRLDVLVNNTQTAHNILEIAKKTKSKVIFISSSDIYGKNLKLPFKEQSDSILGPTEIARWSYAVSKIFDEHLLFGYWEKYKVPFVILRLFNVYGPRQNRNWLGGPQSEFIDAFMQNKSLQIHGTGKQTRSFTYVEDITEAIIKCIENPKATNKVINIGTTEEISIIDFAKNLSKLFKKPLKVKKVSMQALTGRKYDEVLRRKPDISIARKILKWKAKTSLQTGLQKTINWYEKNPT